MDEATDRDLLDRYLTAADEDAFAALVHRHCDLVWATAWRVLGDPGTAEDVTQAVFSLLARKAGRLPAGTVLAGWLHRSAWLEARKQARNAARRTRREQMAMNELDRVQAPDASQLDPGVLALQPLLDAALESLGEQDRQAVILRYLSGRTLAEVGTVLGASDDAAQKRVRRAMDRLRGWFQQRGITAGDGTLAAAFALAGTQTAPPALAAAVGIAALAGAPAAVPLLSSLVLMKSQIALGAVAAIAATTIWWQQARWNRLTQDYEGLRDRLMAAEAAVPASNVPWPGDDDRRREEQAELLRLRGEVAQLRRTQAERDRQAAVPAEERARRAEALAEGLLEEVKFRQFREQTIEMGKRMGLAARIYASDHGDQLPITPEEWQQALTFAGVDGAPGGSGDPMADAFEVYGHPRAPRSDEPTLILLRERTARRIPKPILKEEDLPPIRPFAIPLREGWERIYVLADGSVQTISSTDGSFREFESEGTANPDP